MLRSPLLEPVAYLQWSFGQVVPPAGQVGCVQLPGPPLQGGGGLVDSKLQLDQSASTPGPHVLPGTRVGLHPLPTAHTILVGTLPTARE